MSSIEVITIYGKLKIIFLPAFPSKKRKTRFKNNSETIININHRRFISLFQSLFFIIILSFVFLYVSLLHLFASFLCFFFPLNSPHNFFMKILIFLFFFFVWSVDQNCFFFIGFYLSDLSPCGQITCFVQAIIEVAPREIFYKLALNK